MDTVIIAAFVAGLVVGATAGLILMASLIVSGEAEEKEDA